MQETEILLPVRNELAHNCQNSVGLQGKDLHQPGVGLKVAWSDPHGRGSIELSHFHDAGSLPNATQPCLQRQLASKMAIAVCGLCVHSPHELMLMINGHQAIRESGHRHGLSSYCLQK